MSNNLQTLIERARAVKMTAADREQQRRNFVYGNTKIENKDITRDTIDIQAELLAAHG